MGLDLRVFLEFMFAGFCFRRWAGLPVLDDGVAEIVGLQRRGASDDDERSFAGAGCRGPVVAAGLRLTD